MKQITSYRCDYCSKVYSEEEEARKCEKSHTGISKVEDAVWEPGEKFPYRIYARMRSGEMVAYQKAEVINGQQNAVSVQ